MPVRVKFNRLPRVIARLRPECESGVEKSTDEIAAIARAKVPVDKTILFKTTKGVSEGLHGEVQSGIYRGHGFYAGFVEFGAAQPGAQPPQPYMIPAAHAGETVLRVNMTKAVRDACRA